MWVTRNSLTTSPNGIHQRFSTPVFAPFSSSKMLLSIGRLRSFSALYQLPYSIRKSRVRIATNIRYAQSQHRRVKPPISLEQAMETMPDRVTCKVYLLLNPDSPGAKRLEGIGRKYNKNGRSYTTIKLTEEIPYSKYKEMNEALAAVASHQQRFTLVPLREPFKSPRYLYRPERAKRVIGYNLFAPELMRLKFALAQRLSFISEPGNKPLDSRRLDLVGQPPTTFSLKVVVTSISQKNQKSIQTAIKTLKNEFDLGIGAIEVIGFHTMCYLSKPQLGGNFRRILFQGDSQS